MNIAGMNIIESPLMVKDGEPQEVRRAWRERLFSRPWEPFRATNVVIPKVPRLDAVILGGHTVVVHPVVAAKLRAVVVGDKRP